MHIIFIVCFLLPCFRIAQSKRVVGWYVTNSHTIDHAFPPEKIPWHIYTHIRTGLPYVYPNGTAICDKGDIVTPRVVELAHQHGVKVQWGLGANIHDLLWNPEKADVWANYVNSIATAAEECSIDGIGVDYEWQDTTLGKIGIVLPKQSTKYTHFLADIKRTLGPNKIVSADISIWGVGAGNYLLGIEPWINVSMLNRGEIDFVNTMSYHWNKNGDLWSWKKDIFFTGTVWGMDRRRVNIGLPYFSMNRTKDFRIYNEPTWGALSPHCPNIDPTKNICNKVVFVGKRMNREIGALIKREGFGGAFPWAANYDSLQHNNSLVNYLASGLEGH